MQDWHNKCPKHWLQLAGRSRQQKKMRRVNLGIDLRAQIKARRATVLIRQDLCAYGNVSLSCNARSPFDSAYSKSLPERGQQLRRLLELQPEQIGNHLACYVVAGWTETAGHK